MSQHVLGSSAPGWLNWLSVDGELSMAEIARSVGFRNHPEILDARLEDPTEVPEPWDPIADYEPDRTGPQLIRVHPDSWPMRDAMASMCLDECNPFECNSGDATRRMTLPMSSFYHSAADLTKAQVSAGAKNVQKKELSFELEAYTCCFDQPTSPRLHLYGPLPTQLKRPKHTAELERERPILASDVAITMLSMDIKIALREFSHKHVPTSAILNKLRQQTPLLGFFQLFGKTVLSVAELQKMMQLNRDDWRPSTPSHVTGIVVLDNHAAHPHHRTCVVPSAVYQEFEELQRAGGP